MTELHHCPMCGHLPTMQLKIKDLGWCMKCGFNDAEQGQLYWGIAVRSELARQALELRGSGFDATGNLWRLNHYSELVMADYIWRGENPLMLPGEVKS